MPDRRSKDHKERHENTPRGLRLPWGFSRLGSWHGGTRHDPDASPNIPRYIRTTLLWIGYDVAMPWPEDSLTANETVVTSFRSHWKMLFVPILWGLAVAIVFGIIEKYVDWLFWVRVLIAVGILAFFVVRPIVDWWFTRYVLTTERLMTRSGLVAQRGIEIPLERITNVNFSQSMIERIVGAGDLVVESAGVTGQSPFTNIPHPDTFQALLYKTREARSIALSSNPHAAPPPVAQPPQAPQPTPPRDDAAEAIRKLAGLRDEGLISEDEYERKRAEILEQM